jgi:hypothetical protein
MAPPTDPDTDKAVAMVCHANICNALFAMTVPFIPLRVCQVGNGCELPDGLVPVQAPDWLEAACTADSSSASQLVGRFIIYKWPARVGGWQVGEVRSVNTDKSNMVGEMCANFIVHYECDQQDAQHFLRATAYAKSEKSPVLVDAWVLLGNSD